MESLNKKIEKLSFKLASHQQQKDQEISELQNQFEFFLFEQKNQAKIAIRNMKVESDLQIQEIRTEF